MNTSVTSETGELAIGDLVSRSGVDQRTIRKLVRSGALPPSHGTTRAARYTKTHLDALFEYKSLLDNGHSEKEARGKMVVNARSGSVKPRMTATESSARSDFQWVGSASRLAAPVFTAAFELDLAYVPGTTTLDPECEMQMWRKVRDFASRISDPDSGANEQRPKMLLQVSIQLRSGDQV